MGRVGKLLVLLACIAYPLLLHGFMQKEEVTGWHLLLLVLPLLLIGLWIALRALHKGWWPWVLLLFLAVVYFIVVVPHGKMGLIAVNGISHAVLNLFLLWFFGRTLLRGREPLITQISRRVNGEVVPAIARYTRHVTTAWCIFFGGQVVVSALLYFFASINMWSLFINVLNLPLLILMFVGEYAYRVARYPNHSHTTIMKAIEVYAKDVAVTPKKDSR